MSMSIPILAVLMKGLPKMIGTSSSGISITTKSAGIKNLSTLTKTSSAMPTGYLTDLSASCKDILVALSSKPPTLFIMDSGIRQVVVASHEVETWIGKLAKGPHSVKFLAGIWNVLRWRNNMCLGDEAWSFEEA